MRPALACGSCLDAERAFLRGGPRGLSLARPHFPGHRLVPRGPPAQGAVPSPLLQCRVRLLRATETPDPQRFGPPETPGMKSLAFSCSLYLAFIDSG